MEIFHHWLPKKKVYNFSLKDSERELQSIFWHKTILKIADDIFYHIQEAQKSLEANPAIKDRSYFESLLLPIERSAKKALAERQQTLEFLQQYKN